jgi:cell division protein FtsI/penicillin-binding protein 2
VGLVQKPRSPRPDYVIVVVVEYAGSGGAVSGPIANQVLHAMRAEGYL